MDVLKRLALTAGTGADVAAGVAMAAAVALDALLAARTGKGWPFGLGAGAIICATALLRGRNRARAAVIGLILFALTGLAVVAGVISPGPLFGGGLVGLLVLGAAGVRVLPPRTAGIIGVAGTLVIGLDETAGPGGFFDHRVLWVLAAVTAWSTSLAVGLYLRYLDFAHLQALETARRQERLDLARELHDVVAYHVTGMVVQAQAARYAGESNAGMLLSALDSVETAGTGTLTAIRQLVGLLRDPDESALGPLTEPISQLAQRFSEHGPPVDLRLPAGTPASDWPPEIASTVYRIVQEALTNIARHAPGARSVVVTVIQDPQQLRVEVTDDAPASRQRHTGGYGLIGMQERVEALGGKLRVGPLPGAGWAVQASLPVPAHARP